MGAEPSAPAPPPMWLCVSTMPGMMTLPVRSTTCAPAGACVEERGPMATILPPRTTSTPSATCRPSALMTVAPVYATARCSCARAGAAAHASAKSGSSSFFIVYPRRRVAGVEAEQQSAKRAASVKPYVRGARAREGAVAVCDKKTPRRKRTTPGRLRKRRSCRAKDFGARPRGVLRRRAEGLRHGGRGRARVGGRRRAVHHEPLAVAGEGDADEREAVALRREHHVPARLRLPALLDLDGRAGERRRLVGYRDLARLVVVGQLVRPRLDGRRADPEVRAERERPRLGLGCGDARRQHTHRERQGGADRLLSHVPCS